MVIIVATLGGALALAATAQALLVLGMGRSTLSVTVPFGWDLGRRIFINLLTVIAAVLLVGRLQIEARRPLPAADSMPASGCSSVIESITRARAIPSAMQ